MIDLAPEPTAVELTKVALRRRLAEAQAIRTVQQWWLDEIAKLPEGSAVGPKFWDVQDQLEDRSPAFADLVGIVFQELEDRGVVSVSIEGSLERTDLSPEEHGNVLPAR